MSHEVETMAYTNEVPWHGLGTYIAKAPNVKQMIKAAGLDWMVERRPMFIKNGKGHVEVKDFAALTRNTDNSVLDVVGSRYVPVQNEEAFSFFDEFVRKGGAKMETAGSLKGGRYVWGLANLNAQFKMKGDDVVKGYLLIGCPHEQGKSFLIKFTPVRVVCNNTLTLALRDGGNEFRMVHRSTFDETMMNRAKEALGIARDQLGEFEKNARMLQSLKISKADAIKILAPIYQPKTEVPITERNLGDEGNAKLKRVLDVYEKAPGATPGNAWGVLNAVSYYSDHIASRTADKRLSNAWMGKTANQKELVLNTLIDMAK